MSRYSVLHRWPNAAVTAGTRAMYSTTGVDAATRVGDGATGAGAADVKANQCVHR